MSLKFYLFSVIAYLNSETTFSPDVFDLYPDFTIEKVGSYLHIVQNIPKHFQ